MRFLLRPGALVTMTILLLANVVVAQKVVWQPPEPSVKSKDRILLTSGEWLRGELKGIRDEHVEFDSEELGLLTLDWGDIAEIRSPRVLTYGFEGGLTATGTAAMKDGVLRIRVGDEVREFPRGNLLTIIESDLTELNLWSLKASAGLIARSGNTDQADANALVYLRRESSGSRLDLNYQGNFGEVNNVQSVNNHRFDSMFNILVTKGFFFTPAVLSLYSDKFQNISIRYVLAAAAGYFVVRRGNLEWYLQLGGGYSSTQFVSVQPGENEEESSATVIPATSLEWDITGDLDLDVSYKAQITVPDTRNTLHNLTALFALKIYGALDFTFSLTWDRVESPKQAADGTIPQRNDFRTSFGIGVDI